MVGLAFASNHRINVLAAVTGLGMAFYLAIEPTPQWLLLLLAALVGIGTDAIIRSHPTTAAVGPTDTVVYLAVPVLAIMATGIALEEAASGYWSLLAAVLVTPPLAALFYALYLSLEASAPTYQPARIALNAAACLVAFAFYALAYEYELGVIAAAFVVGLTSALLALLLLLEGEGDIYRLSLYSGLVGLVMAEARWALNSTPLDYLLAAAFLLSSFYLLTGLLQRYFSNRLTWRAAGEFATTAMIALVIIMIAHAVN